MIKTFEQFLFEWTREDNDDFFAQIRSAFEYDARGWNEIMDSEKAWGFAMKKYDKFNTKSFKSWFSGSVVKNEDGSPEVVHHSSQDEFTQFRTPAFFGSNGTSNAYWGEYYYYCVLQLKNPLEMRKYKLGHDEWMKRVREMLEGSSNFESRMDFAEKYEDGYGFFKLLEGDRFGDPYLWPMVYDYIRKKGHDGMIYRESDQSIQWFFEGYIVMKPEQIKIIHVQKHED